MNKHVSTMVMLLSLMTAILYSCKHEIPLPPDTGLPGGVSGIPGSVGRPCSTDSVYFANSIFPLISSTCATTGCHDAASHVEGVVLTSYNNIMKYVNAGNAGNSKLYKVIIRTDNERMPPPPAPAWSAEQKAALQKWINQGAKNNACDKCDTIDFKYSTAIKVIMQNKCQGCHNPASLGGNVDLSTHTGVRNSALSGKLYGSVIWSAGISAMPKGGFKLPDCEITQIRKWIEAGSLNN